MTSKEHTPPRALPSLAETAEEPNKGWFSDPPQKVGSFWFFGWISAKERKQRIPEFYLVDVMPLSNGVTYVTHGQFVYPRHLYGVWRKVEMPPVPPLVMATFLEKKWSWTKGEENFCVELDPDVFPDLKIPED